MPYNSFNLVQEGGLVLNGITYGQIAPRTLHPSNICIHVVTGDIKAHQVLLNRVPEQATEDSIRYQILLLRINFRVEITIFTQCDEVLKQ